MFKNPFSPSVGENDLIKHKYGIYHNCPFCKKECSVNRLLPWLASCCIEDGKAEFPCDTCGKYVIFPKEAFLEIFLNSVSEQDHERPNVIRYKSNSATIIGQKTPKDIFKKNWFEIFLKANSNGPRTIDQIDWDGTGTCPGCGQDSPKFVSQSVECMSCEKSFNINQKNISKETETKINCPNCNKTMIILPKVWCPKCNRNLRDSELFLKLFKDSNKQPDKNSSTFYRFLKNISAIILLIIGTLMFHFTVVRFVYTLNFLNDLSRTLIALSISISVIIFGSVVFGWNYRNRIFKYVFIAISSASLVSLSAILIYDSLVPSLPKPFYVPVNSIDYKELLIGIGLLFIASLFVFFIAQNGVNYKGQILKSSFFIISIFFSLGVLYSMLSWPNITEPYWFTSRSIHKPSSTSQLYYRDRYAFYDQGQVRIPIQSFSSRKY
jgi:hypothetical protein